MSGYERDQRFIVGHFQPAALIDLALSRGIDSHRLLRGCDEQAFFHFHDRHPSTHKTAGSSILRSASNIPAISGDFSMVARGAA